MRVARQAMATRFEILLYGDKPTALRAAGEEALDEVQRLEARLSLYRPASEIARVNARAHEEPVRVSRPVFQLLELAWHLQEGTGGAFDITLGPLLRCWGLMGGAGRVPTPEELATARASTGMSHVCLDPENCTVRFDRAGVMLDLGAIGKGHAVELAANVLREAGVASGFIHGGTSSSYAIGHPPDQAAWKVALELPFALTTADARLGAGPATGQRGAADAPLVVPASAGSGAPSDRGGGPPQHAETHVQPGLTRAGSRTPFAVVPLTDESLSVSAVWGKSFQAGGRFYGHVIDPRTGAPAETAVLAAVVLPSATDADALSTALLVLGPAGQARANAFRPGTKSVIIHRQAEVTRIESSGIALLP